MTKGRRTISAADFKAQCLGLLDRVATTKEVLVVTKRGRPVAKVVPLDDADAKPLRGSVRYVGDVVAPLETSWKVDD